MKKIIKAIVLAFALTLPMFFANNTFAIPSCGACVIGTAPSSVSAHKNVNNTMTACAVCHNANPVAGSIGGHPGEMRSGDSRGSTDGTGGDRDNHPSSPGNSDFGRSHKYEKKQLHEYDD